jgi:hypothetical protein
MEQSQSDAADKPGVGLSGLPDMSLKALNTACCGQTRLELMLEIILSSRKYRLGVNRFGHSQ